MDDTWEAACGCIHVLVGDDCPCGPTWGFDAEGPLMFHNDPHSPSTRIVDGR